MVYIASALLVASLLYWWHLITKDKSAKVHWWTTFIVTVCNFSLFSFLAYRWFQNSYFPLSNLYESLVFLAWCLTAIQLIMASQTSSRIIGAIVTPISMLVVSFSTFLPREMQVPAVLVPALQSNWLMFHVSMMIFSYATLILGSLLAFLLLTLFLKKNRVFSNPYLLKNLDIWSYRIIGLGHIALTLGILAGAVWANESWGSYWSWDPKETWSLITWLIFTVYLHTRLVNNWKGFPTALIGSIGFISIWISYLGVNFLASGLHSYGWVK